MLKAIKKFNFTTLVTTILACVIGFMSNSLYANENPYQNSIDAKQWYQIDYVIFEHLQTDKHILRYESIPYPTKKNRQYTYLTSNPNPMSPYQFTLLNKEIGVLTEAIKRLDKSRLVKVLDSGSWQQTLSEDLTSPPLRINKDISNKRSLFGEIQLTKSRFTHAALTLYLGEYYTVPYMNISEWFLAKDSSWGIIDLISPLTDLEFNPPISTNIIYKNLVYLDESRRIKDGEIHYIDHPALSVIITIKETPIPTHLNNYLSYNID